MKYLATLLFLLLVGCASSSDRQMADAVVETEGNISSVTAVGNLEKTHELPCISLEESQNSYTPADLYSSAAKCVLQGRDKDAAQVFFLASAYGMYDGLRVNDPTAAQARQVLIMNNFNAIDESKKAGLRVEMGKLAARQSPEFEELCLGIRSVGKPDYHPQYMILHGIAAFRGIEGDGLKPDYDSAANWSAVLAQLKCP